MARPMRADRLRRKLPQCEWLENRLLLSTAVGAQPQVISGGGPTGFTPSQIRNAYRVSAIKFGTVTGDGTGQTIAIVDAYDTPNIATELATFDTYFGLPAPPSFKRVAQDGSTHYPPVDPNSSAFSPGWEAETAIDVEWAHAIAPKASILLVESKDSAFANLMVAAPNYARSQPGVSVVSMSFGVNETSFHGADSTYTTPAGHAGVTFVAGSGDFGSRSSSGGSINITQYPASSPNVLSVGGTSLTLANGAYGSETTWSPSGSGVVRGSGGGISSIEKQPAYQRGVAFQSATFRTVPDVAMDADPNTAVAVYDSYTNPLDPWTIGSGTSLATPMWAGLIAIADQGRALSKLPALDGVSQTLPAIYSLPQSDFHDITTGNNGAYTAGPGYDLTTGRGSPIANVLVPALAAYALPKNAPIVGGITASTTSVIQNTSFTLKATGVTDVGGNPQVAFFRESNGVAGLQINGDTFVGNGTYVGSGVWSASISTTQLPVGMSTFYAVAGVEGGLFSALGTGAKLVAVKVTALTPPVIASFTASSSTIAHSTTSFVLTASGVSEPNGTIKEVDFYLELNGTPGLQTDPSTGDYLDSAVVSSTRWTDTVDPSFDFDPRSGVYTFYAIAIDTNGHMSAPVSLQVSYTGGVTAAPTVAKLAASAITVAAGAKVTLTASGFKDTASTPAFVTFYRESNAKTGLQAGIGGDVVVGTVLGGKDPSAITIVAPTTAGTYTYYAQMTDRYGVSTAAVKVTITVTSAAALASQRLK